MYLKTGLQSHIHIKLQGSSPNLSQINNTCLFVIVLCLCEDFIDLSVRVGVGMSGAPGGRARDVKLLLDDGASAAGGLARARRNPISWLMNCASHVCRTQNAGEICEDIPHCSRYIDNDNNDCFTVQMGFSEPQQYYFAF